MEKNDNGFAATPIDKSVIENLEALAEKNGGVFKPDAEHEKAVGYTHFDSYRSEENRITVLLTMEKMDSLPLQAMVRIKSRKDNREYIGTVVSGPFAEPDGLSPESTILVSTTVQGKVLTPRYHGRAFIEIVGEVKNEQVIPPRYRPRPNSPVFLIDSAETAKFLKVEGDISIGLAFGYEDIEIKIPSDKKSVLPRHTGILGTTGGGKSTTVSGLLNQLSKVGIASIIFDVEGEYTEIDSPTSDKNMIAALESRGLKPEGIKDVSVFVIEGKESTREKTDKVKKYSVAFSEISPYTIIEILGLSEAQRDRFIATYEICKILMVKLKLVDQKLANEAELLDEQENGFPGLTLSFFIDVATYIHGTVSKFPTAKPLWNKDLNSDAAKREMDILIGAFGYDKDKSPTSWQILKSRLWELQRMKVFDVPRSKPLNYSTLLKPNHVSVVDMSDIESPDVRNIMISSFLKGIQRAQEDAFNEAIKKGEKPTPTVIFIEEAHEFLSTEKIKQMPIIYQQVAKIAKRGRKRWLGLAFVTQLPQHLPNEVLALINNYILHKIADHSVIDRLKKTVVGLDDSQWGMVPGLASGQAVVAVSSMSRPLLVSVHPTPVKLRMVD